MRKNHGPIGVVAMLAAAQALAAAKPAVLFEGGVHATYAARPLHELGLEVDSCATTDLRQRLESGKYNVLVAGALTDETVATIARFMERGGGVFCSFGTFKDGKAFEKHFNWLATKGARLRWEHIGDGDPENTVSDVMRQSHSWSSNITPPFNEDVRGVLINLRRPGGDTPFQPFGFEEDWTVVVRGPDSMSTRPAPIGYGAREQIRVYVPKEGLKASPAFLGVRNLGKGRLAVSGVRTAWTFHAPVNCPTAEAMLLKGAGSKPSDWLQVFANVFEWLAEPSLEAGLGGATTPEAVLQRKAKYWAKRPFFDWEKLPQIPDQDQVPGLVGARTAMSSGTGTVADYVAAARAAGLSFITFLEDGLKMDEAKWDKLVKDCENASDPTFAAVPGMTLEDAQGDHMFVLGDRARFPQPEVLLPDGRLKTTQAGNRMQAMFTYVSHYMWPVVFGFWNHNKNFLHPADYKLYNSFAIFSSVDGKQVDAALDAYSHQLAVGECQAAFALEIMHRPELVAERARNGWRVVVMDSPSWKGKGLISNRFSGGAGICA